MTDINQVYDAKKEISIAKEVVTSEIRTLEYMREHIDENFVSALDVMSSAKGRIVITGIGKSGHIGRKIAASLASTGTPSFFVHPAEAAHGDLGMITTDDVVVAISNSGEARELVDVLNYCKRFGIRIIAITKNQDSTLAQASDVLLQLPALGEACPLGLAPTNSTTATLVIGDILTVGMMHRNGFTMADFNARHPGGKLGYVLQRVSNIMHTGDSIPLVPESNLMDNALLEMTSKRLGCVGVTNKQGQLVGVITDGDLRRAMNAQLIFTPVTKVMSRCPKSVSSDTFATEAIKIMNDNHITNLFVVDENKMPIGIVHIHDLLMAKVA